LAYIVPPRQQGRVGPKPQRINYSQDGWESLERVGEFQLAGKATTIKAFDDILVAALCEDGHGVHNDRCRVIECRRYEGKYYLLVLWWVDRKALAKPFQRTQAYLKEKWPSKAPFKYVLGVHFDIITSDTIVRKFVSTRGFCTTMMYGGKHFNFEMFSDVPKWTIRSDILSGNGDAKKLIRKEKLQKELYQKYVLKQ
jgi:hypothetical protein